MALRLVREHPPEHIQACIADWRDRVRAGHPIHAGKLVNMIRAGNRDQIGRIRTRAEAQHIARQAQRIVTPHLGVEDAAAMRLAWSNWTDAVLAAGITHRDVENVGGTLLARRLVAKAHEIVEAGSAGLFAQPQGTNA